MKINRTTTAAQVQRATESVQAKPPITRTEHERPQRAERIPFGMATLKLEATSIPGMHLHWINDWHPQMPDRLQQALAAGYTFVTQEEARTRQNLGGSYSTGTSESQISRVVGVRPDGLPITAFLMKIPEEWHLDHQRPVWERADNIDGTIRKGMVEASQEDRRTRYIPKGSPISLRSKLEQGEVNGESE